MKVRKVEDLTPEEQQDLLNWFVGKFSPTLIDLLSKVIEPLIPMLEECLDVLKKYIKEEQ
jgi:hypothetical protein